MNFGNFEILKSVMKLTPVANVTPREMCLQNFSTPHQFVYKILNYIRRDSLRPITFDANLLTLNYLTFNRLLIKSLLSIVYVEIHSELYR